jgi:hypothetical protein
MRVLQHINNISHFILPHLTYSTPSLSTQKTAISIAGSIFVKCPMNASSYKIQERIFQLLIQNIARGLQRPDFAKGNRAELNVVIASIRSTGLVLSENKNLLKAIVENDTVYSLVRAFEFEPSLLNRTISNGQIQLPSGTDSEFSDGDLTFGRSR